MVEVIATDGQNSSKSQMFVTIVDDCYKSPCGSNKKDICVDMFKSYICNCNNGYVGLSCDPSYVKSTSSQSGNNNSVPLIVGLVIGVTVLIAIIIVLIIIVGRQNKINDATSKHDYEYINSNMMNNPLFTLPVNIVPSSDDNENLSFTNPMYGINNINMQYDGDFKVRSSKETPSWHQLSVRINDNICNDMIRTHMNGTYELVAQNREIGEQPKHSSMEDLIRYYSEDRGVGYVLVNNIDNPLYSITSPQLPIKNNQKDMIRSLAEEQTSELYGNVSEAKAIVVNDKP
jgi:hypothetical protein